MMRLHLDGGINFMLPLTLMLLSNLVMIGIALYRKHVSHTDTGRLSIVIHHVSMLALVWGALATAIGLFYAFGSLAEMKETLPMNVIMGGLRVALITVIYGMVIFLVSRVGIIFLKPVK